MANENKDEEIVAIPGLRGRPPKEISLKNLASIIQARMEEIIEHIYYEIKTLATKKLIAGIVLTGGGSQLRHLAQLTEFMTGMDTRIGYPNEHLAGNAPDEMHSPMHATGIGLVLEGVARLENNLKEIVKSMTIMDGVEKRKYQKKRKEGQKANRLFTKNPGVFRRRSGIKDKQQNKLQSNERHVII